jgi:hypothetical protein
MNAERFIQFLSERTVGAMVSPPLLLLTMAENNWYLLFVLRNSFRYHEVDQQLFLLL